jgi:YbbR domain-containing protein
VKASIDVTGKAATVTLEARVQILDARGRALSQVTATPPKVTVTQQINLVKLQKVVAVTPTISGTPAPGFRITLIDYSPLTLDPSGPQNDVQNLTSLTTDTIEITGATADVVRTVNVKLPAGVTLTQPETGRITVHVHIASETATPSPSASP